MEVLPKLIVFSAPSGAGKTTLVRHLLTKEELNLAFSISAASREAREGEVEGKDYYFLGTKEFKNRIRANDFLEFEEVYQDQFYGTLKDEVERLWAQGKNVIFDIDVVGGLRLKEKFPNRTLSIFVKPPSINELQIRLKKRKTETAEKIAMRVAKASTEMATAPQFDVIIKNDDLSEAKALAYQTVLEFINKKVSDG
ncbi:guanylate kinase [Nonlabens sp. MB-3u-79]|jgi:guanylate kinase|uniref:guanylate kinase n=1 Tax=Nonlabens sp. MB-3u-79 TaxID=2058134 RepID=UPI000C3011A2|nr:guanylate kinase [Nonlabens sp. MB-3u-79]AUC78505.1 guanylate kinase [Nonlabens sp. MB-3u-79]|tara:strand:- start:52633 stop:53223 length:591 start_codon:yes stop_codon:yes gene_type:complete